MKEEKKREGRRGRGEELNGATVGGARAGKSSVLCGSSSHCPQCGDILVALDLVLESTKRITLRRLL